jgi:hypothetical protein
VLTVCWSVKGGVGTTVTTAAWALAAARRDPGGALVVDLAGDLPAALGCSPGASAGPGVADWLAAGPGVPPDALTRLAQPVEAEPRLRLLPRGRGPLASERAELLMSLLASGRQVVVDAGRTDALQPDRRVGEVLAGGAERSLLVTSACLLALGRARDLAVRPTGVVLVREPTRALRTVDVERALGVPVVLEVAVDPAVARAVDAGLLASRLPRAAQAAFARAEAA